jgi:Tol biopolymer transport system component
MKPLVLALSVVGLVSVAAACGGNDGARSAGPVPSVPVEVEPATAPAASPETVSGVSAAPEVDYVIDLNTGVKTALPESIIRTLEELPEHRGSGQYAASIDGSQLAYVGSGRGGEPQIFVAGIDGEGVRQVTHEPKGAKSPAWSPDGRTIAYLTATDLQAFCVNCHTPGKLKVVDVATGESTQILDEAVWDVQFTPDGSSLLYTHDERFLLTTPTLRTVPVGGGESTLFIGPDGGLTDALSGSLSPDGSLVTYLASGDPVEGGGHCGPCRWVANADGTDRRTLPCWATNPSGTWSPDGSRIVCRGDGSPLTEGSVYVVDVATGLGSKVAEGVGAIWLDDHTLLVEV